MFRTKSDVDRHVQESLRKVKNEKERNLRCYNIAQQYYKVRAYEAAKYHLSLYLSVKEDSPLAHKLQGQIYEGLGDKNRALNAYKTSLEYEANQPDLVLRMCELLCDTDVAMDVDRAHYWCERASDLFPHDPVVFRLKEKLLKLGGKANTRAFEDLINSEMKARPNDVSVRTRLMRLYLETGRTQAAYNHAVELEASHAFQKELVWYECFAQVCQAYAEEFPSLADWQVFCTWVAALDQVASLSLSDFSAASAAKKVVDCLQAVYSMDQVLFKAANTTASRENGELYKQFLRHMSAQLCLHIATLILKRAKKEASNWRDATRAVPPMLFLALTPPPDTEAPWCHALRPQLKHSLTLWAADAAYRVSQAGYTLLSLSKDAGNQFTEKVTHMASGNWRERAFQKMFLGLDQRSGATKSHFVNSELLGKVPVRLPSHDSGVLRTRELVPVYEKVRDTLHHLVWLGLETSKHNNKKLPPDFHTTSFSRLKLTALNLSNTSPETLSVLDVDAFLYATVLCAAATLEEEVRSGFYSGDRPLTLPADIANLLCTQEQMSWWTAACQVNSQQVSSNNLVMMRQLLKRGLEVVRVEGSHGLDVLLIVKLARTFADRAEVASGNGKSGDQAALEQRASLYWNAALPMLERLERHKAPHLFNSKFFEYHRKELPAAEVSSLLEEGRYFVACQFMKCEQYEKAIEAFKPLRSPYASFKQALIYKKLAAGELEERPREEITSEMRSKHVILLTKARECLNLTWERVRIDRRHPLHETLPDHISEVETALSRIEPDPDMDRNLLGTPRSLDFSMQRLGMSFQSSNLNRSDGEGNISEASLSSMGSPAAGDMGLHSAQRLNGRTPGHRHNTPHRHQHTPQDYRRHVNNGELVDVGQLLQIQTLLEEVKKIHEKLAIIMTNVNELRLDVNRLKAPGTEDLYLFGDEEEYPDEVLNGQYPPTFVPPFTTGPQPAPAFYPPPTRGVQGTSTVTYGAPPQVQPPPVIPLIPMRMPLDPTLAGYQPPQNLAFYNQGPLPFTEPHHLQEFLRPSIPKPVLPQQPPIPLVNVVITTSDTLPTGPPPVQPTLSVTIPPQHRLGTLPVNTPPLSAAITSVSSAAATPPHKFQIPMPATATIPTLEKSPIVIPDEVDSDDDNEVGYDPCPDFRPIIPLPNEVNVTTGEEDDDVLFENRAKLFRFADKEWKERGVGNVKILKNRATDKVRLLMRRDQVHKVCANHLLKSEMELTMLKNSDRALVWVANDFAEEELKFEQFCIKFKTPEEAMHFRDVFNDAKTKYGQSPTKHKSDEQIRSEKSSVVPDHAKSTDTAGKVNVGGFTFTSPPKFKEPEKVKPQDENKKEPQAAPSPFAAFTFKPQRSSDGSVKQSVMAPPLFAGLNSTQNKHTLFLDEEEESPIQPPASASPQDLFFRVPNDNLPKTILKQPVLPSVQPFTPAPVSYKDFSQKPLSESTTGNSQAKPLFNITPQTTPVMNAAKETPKSILKDPPSTTIPVSGTKPSPAAKHVLFQDAPDVSPSQQTPTLAALLKTPKTPVVDFAALSKMNENKTPQFGSESKSSGFEGAGSAVFGRARNDSEGENAEEFIPSAEFKPVIPLPELVEVKTGEEGEEVLFNERAKLLRFESSTKEWKERGIGQMKILKDPATGITRFLMRREQVHKVCCNHRIIQSLELKPSPSSEKAWTWYAVDYSEGETKNELFAIRFKTAQLAKEFKETVDKAQKQLREEGTCKRSCPDSAQQEDVASPSSVWKCQFCLFPNSCDSRTCKACSKSKSETNALPKLSELFRPKTGSWECKACYTVNGIKDNTCVSCDSPKEKPKSPVSEKTAVPSPSLAEMFKPKAGSWECDGCLVRNEADKTVCPACSTPKPGHEGDVKELPKSNLSFSTGSFSFGIKPADVKNTGFSFGITPSGLEETPKSSFTFGIKTEPKTPETAQTQTPLFNLKQQSSESVEAGKTTTGFSFGQNPTSKAASPFIFAPRTEVMTSSADSTTTSSLFDSKASGTMFSFGNTVGDTSNSKVSFLFGAPPSPSNASDDGGKFAFGQSGKFEFNFSGVKSQVRSPGPKSPRSPSTGNETDSEGEDEEEEEVDHIHFQPVVPLPDKVPVTTGEEDEAVLYSRRAKLYRFSQGEWKERGVGDIKILRHNNTQKIRLLMRREPILKICLNHFLTADLRLTPKDDRSWLWYAQDFTDGELSAEQFCLRLKTPDVAKEFKAAVESAQGDLEAARSGNNSLVNSFGVSDAGHSHDHELEIVYEAHVSEELRQAALRLQLPPNFYSYLTAPPCSGCSGCDPDSEDEDVKPKPSTTSSKIKTSAVTPSSVASQPFPPAVSTTESSAMPSQPFTFTVNTTSSLHSSSQPFSFAVKTTTVTSTTTSSVFGFSTTKQSPVTTASTPLLPTPTAVQSGFTFSLTTTTNQTTPPSISSPALSSLGGSPLFQSQAVGKPLGGAFDSKSGTPLLFGTTSSTQPATTLTFGNGSAQNTKPSIFGGLPLNQTTKGVPPFHSTAVTSTPSIFAGLPSAQTPKGSSFMSNTAFTSTPSIFGDGQSPSSVFGTPTTTPATTSPKGSSFFSNLTSFQTPPQTSLFGGPSPPFGTQTAQSPFGGASLTPGGQSTDSSNSGPAFLFKPTTTFSDIAVQEPAFGSDKASNNFSWAGAGASVFGVGKTKEEESGGESGPEEAEGETSHDPVFEPIVPLPNAIQVRTGEEDEEKEFCYRAKFYRYDKDNKEWKERGVGDMKILRHPETHTYRLLLRREQVHKVVCNQLITGEMNMVPLASSDKAFSWAAMNMAEEYSEPQLEQVAVRFKNADIAAEFRAKLDECIAVVKARKQAGAVSESLEPPEEALEPAVTIEEVSTEYSEGEEVEVEGEYLEGEYLEGEESEPMFEKRATLYTQGEDKDHWSMLGQGELSLYYHQDMNTGNIIFKPDGADRIVMSVGLDSDIQQVKEREVTWSGQEYGQEDLVSSQNYKAEFSSPQATYEFMEIFSEILELSRTLDSSYVDSDQED